MDVKIAFKVPPDGQQFEFRNSLFATGSSVVVAERLNWVKLVHILRWFGLVPSVGGHAAVRRARTCESQESAVSKS